MGENLVTLAIICTAGKWIHSKSILVSIVSKKVWIHSHHKASTSLGIVAIRVLGVSWRQSAHVGTTWNHLEPGTSRSLGAPTSWTLHYLGTGYPPGAALPTLCFSTKNQAFWKASQFWFGDLGLPNSGPIQHCRIFWERLLLCCQPRQASPQLKISSIIG